MEFLAIVMVVLVIAMGMIISNLQNENKALRAMITDTNKTEDDLIQLLHLLKSEIPSPDASHGQEVSK